MLHLKMYLWNSSPSGVLTRFWTNQDLVYLLIFQHADYTAYWPITRYIRLQIKLADCPIRNVEVIWYSRTAHDNQSCLMYDCWTFEPTFMSRLWKQTLKSWHRRAFLKLFTIFLVTNKSAFLKHFFSLKNTRTSLVSQKKKCREYWLISVILFSSWPSQASQTKFLTMGS